MWGWWGVQTAFYGVGKRAAAFSRYGSLGGLKDLTPARDLLL